jgi:two-component system NtrC family sensor kinase
VQDTLTLVRAPTVHRASPDLSTVVAAYAREMAAELTTRGIALRLDGLAQLGTLAIHWPTLRRALLNLGQNAMDTMPQGGTLTIRGRRDPVQAHLELCDTGTGIPAAHLPHLFEPLYTTKPAGTGLGLSIVWEIVAAHGGQVAVQSTGSCGTTFTITLPVADIG